MISGEAYCRIVFRTLPRRRAPNSRYCVVFDIDNTLVDTRYRTRAAATAFAQLDPVKGAALKQLKVKDILRDGRETAQQIKLDPRTTRAFARFWEPYFWNPKNFSADSPLLRTIRIAEDAKRANVEVYYLTGRIQSLFKGTMNQLQGLERVGLPSVKKSHLICKPDLDTPTAQFKLAEIKHLRGQGIEPLLFITDSLHEIAAVQQRNAAPCVLVDFPGQTAGPPIHATTPIIRIPRR